MKLKKRKILRFTLLIFISVTILASCGREEVAPERALNNFSKTIEEENLDDLRLTIYYFNTLILHRAPLSVDDLVNSSDVIKVVVSGSGLATHIDLLKQLNKDVLQPVENSSRVDARFYYVFETKKNRKIFDVAMWGDDYSIFVNGVAFQDADIFYDVIIPFVSEYGVGTLEANRDDNP